MRATKTSKNKTAILGANTGGGAFTETDVRKLFIDYGSPLFFLSEQLLREQYRTLHNALKKEYPLFAIAYPYKTNYLPRICQILKEEGAGAEVSSGFEYLLAKKLGYLGHEIVFNGPLKHEKDLERAFRDRCILNIDNYDEFKKTARVAKKLGGKNKIGIRLNSIKRSLGKYRYELTRFGFNVENGEADAVCADIKRSPNLELAGFHMHIGTNLSSPEVYLAVAETLVSFALRVKDKLGVTVEFIDVGGGFGVRTLIPKNCKSWNMPPIENFIRAVAGVIKKNMNPRPRLIVEPGRFLVAECMSLATRVIAVRYIGSGSAHVVVDASMSMAPTLLNLHHPMRALTRVRSRSESLVTTIFGSSCTPVDILGVARLPPLRENDIILAGQCGAYSLSRSSQFVSPRPAVLSVRPDGTTAVVRRPEHPRDLTSLDTW